MAELPRYEKQIRSAQTDVSPALHGIGAAQQGSALLQKSLNQKLSAFFESGKGVAEASLARAAEKIALQVIETTGEYRHIGSSGANWFKAYKDTYNKVADAKYIADTDIQASMDASRISNQYRFDPEGFKKVFMDFAKSATGKAPSERVRAEAINIYNKHAAKHYDGILTRTFAKQRDDQKKSLDAYYTVLTKEYNDAISAGDQESANKKVMQIMALQESAISNGLKTHGEVALQQNELIESGYKTAKMAEFQNSKDKYEYLKQMRDDKQSIEVLGIDGYKKLKDSMLSALIADNNVEEEQQMAINAAVDARAREAKADLKTKHIEGSLTPSDIEEYFGADLLTPSERDSWLKIANTKGTTVPNLDLEYQYRQTILAYSEDDIRYDDGLTGEQKLKLLAFRQGQLKDQVWVSSENGKFAIERVKNHFKMVNLTQFGITASKEDIHNFNTVYNAFIDEMLQTNPAEREQKALTIANAAIKSFSEAESQARLNKAVEGNRIRRESELEEVQALNKEYEESLPEGKKAYYKVYYGEFMTTFGKTGALKF